MADGLDSHRRDTAWTNSPWFWLILFLAMGQAALFVVAPKYQKRQGRLITQFEARQARPEESESSLRSDAAREGQGDPPTSSPEGTAAERMAQRSRLRPLMILVAAVLLSVGVSLLVVRIRSARADRSGVP